MSSTDWVAQAADDACAEADQRSPGVLVCASGLSPSGPIHLGNLRELLTQHFVAEELRGRGVAVEHVLFWDDYDRLRRIPAGIPATAAEYLGRPLSEVPDPLGEYPSWAQRFAAPVRDALHRLGVPVREVSQAQRYGAGVYAEPVCRAMAARDRIAAVLAEYRTGRPEPDAGYYPYRPYCRRCRRDSTTVTAYDEASTALRYECSSCGARDGFALRDESSGKLQWKVDWPMRWAYEPVVFEAAGADHASPGSSAAVGARLCREVFDARPPVFLGYGFVGTRGMAKLSSSAGGVPTPADALGILEPAILRWLYARRRPNQSITVDFGTEVTRLYDEWDRLGARLRAGTAGPAEAVAARRARHTSAGPLAEPAHPVGWRLLSSVLDITAGDDAQLLRILSAAEGASLVPADIQPRRDLAGRWLATQVPPEARTRVRDEPDHTALAALDPEQRRAIDMLLAELPGRTDLAALTSLVYGIPKRLRGMTEDAAPTPEIRTAQRDLFTLLYRLLLDSDTGPRLPTLLLALGPERVAGLLRA